MLSNPNFISPANSEAGRLWRENPEKFHFKMRENFQKLK
jgi:ubiquitin-protein ligase